MTTTPDLRDLDGRPITADVVGPLYVDQRLTLYAIRARLNPTVKLRVYRQLAMDYVRERKARENDLARARLRESLTPPRVVRHYIRTEDPRDDVAKAKLAKAKEWIEVRWDDHDPNQTILGDPPPGRSALCQRRNP